MAPARVTLRRFADSPGVADAGSGRRFVGDESDVVSFESHGGIRHTATSTAGNAHGLAHGKATAIVQQAMHGLGGVGKTRLAVQWAWQHSEQFSAVLFVTADTPATLRQKLAEMK